MMEQNIHELSDKVKTFITEGFDGWQAGFTVEQQTFYLQPVSPQKGDQGDTSEKAKWYQKNIEFALQKLITNSYQSSTGEQKQESAGVWIKASERLPDTVECEIVFRTISGKMFVKEILWNTKLVADDKYYEWFDENPESLPAEQPNTFTYDDLEYVLSEFICTYAPHHSAIESHWMFINRSLKERKGRPLTEKPEVNINIDDWFDTWKARTKRNGGVLIGSSIKELLTDFKNYIINHKLTRK